MKKIKLIINEFEQQGSLTIQKDRYMIIWLRNYRVFKSAKQMHRFERATRNSAREFKIVETTDKSFKLLPLCYRNEQKEYTQFNLNPVDVEII